MSRIDEILKLAEKYREYTAENLSALVKAKSMSGGEKEAADTLAAQMRAAGFDEVKIDPLGNVIGRIGSGGKILAFDAHIDTVDTGNLDNWKFDPFSGEIRDGFVHGRGSGRIGLELPVNRRLEWQNLREVAPVKRQCNNRGACSPPSGVL